MIKNEILTKQAIKDNLFAMRFPKEWRKMITDKIWAENKINWLHPECLIKVKGL